ncbi:MAG: Gfo/Idh/MocA family oxidoreductase [Lentisphaerae bacterium]|mgnify:CR=1 FL=1|nr:Gfo/Idh/MocA family oxidoreductase [Lentisphaerota bacterium]
MRRKTRICFIGCGAFCRSFVPLFKAHPDVEYTAVCDLIPERAQKYHEMFDVPIVPTFEDAISDPNFNAVAIFVQRHLHGPLVIEALKAGKNVYSAVPVASTIEEIVEIERLVRKTGLTYSMGETGYYRACAVFCREKMASGEMGDFVYGEAQYNHDQRHFHYSEEHHGKEWKKIAGIPPMLYPTHSTSMILGCLPGVYVKKLSAFGYEEKYLTDIFGREDQNYWGNPFSNTAMLCQLSNGGIARISENRRLAFAGPNSYISQFYGSEGCYEFAVSRHYFTHWDKNDPQKLLMDEVSHELLPKSVTAILNEPGTPQKISDQMGFWESAPRQHTERIPIEYRHEKNGHNGCHHFMVDDFCQAMATGLLSPTNIWQSARFNIPGLVAHQSAMQGGVLMDVPDLGDPPEDWPVLKLD